MAAKKTKPSVQLRTPSPLPVPAGAAAFVRGAAAATSPAPEPASAADPPELQGPPSSKAARQPAASTSDLAKATANGRVLLPRKDGQGVRRMTIYMRPDLATELALARARTGKDVSAMISEAVESYLLTDAATSRSSSQLLRQPDIGRLEQPAAQAASCLATAKGVREALCRRDRPDAHGRLIHASPRGKP